MVIKSNDARHLCHTNLDSKVAVYSLSGRKELASPRAVWELPYHAMERLNCPGYVTDLYEKCTIMVMQHGKNVAKLLFIIEESKRHKKAKNLSS